MSIELFEYKNSYPRFVGVNEKNQREKVDINIAVFTPTEADSGESHVIEHCIASEISHIVGNIAFSAYVFHNITYYNIQIQKENIGLIDNIIEIIVNPKFLKEKSIFNRESHNIQYINGVRRIGGVVLNEVLNKCNNKKYVLLNNIPKSLSDQEYVEGVSGGTVERILHLTYDQCKNYFQKYYTKGNMCISITGGMPEEFRERISKKYSKNSKVFNDNKFLKTWKGNQIELRTKKFKTTYFTESDGGDSIYSINIKLLLPKNNLEYNFYYCVKEKIQYQCQKKGLRIQVELRNTIRYVYIATIYKNYQYSKIIYQVLYEVFNESETYRTPKSYIEGFILENNGTVKGEVVIRFLAEAYFAKLPIKSFLQKKDTCLDVEKLIKNVEIGELEVFPVSKNILSQIFKNYIVSPNANFYQPQEFTVNWEKIEIENIPYLLPAYDIKLVKKIKVNNVTIYYYQDKISWIKIFFNVTGVEDYTIFLLGSYVKRINCMLDTRKMKLSPLPIYNYYQRSSNTYIVLSLLVGKYNDIDVIVNKILNFKITKKILYNSLNSDIQETEALIKKNIVNLVTIRVLAYFRTSELHKDLLFGLSRIEYAKIIKSFLECENNIEDLSLKDILKRKVEIIGASFPFQANNLMSNKKSEKYEYINIQKPDIPKDETIFVNAGGDWIAAGVDIKEIDRKTLSKYKILCELITNLYFLNFLRERSVYYGEINLIDDVLIVIVNSQIEVVDIEEIQEQLKNFVSKSFDNIINIFPIWLKKSWNKKDFNLGREQQILNQIFRKSLRDPLLGENITREELQLFMSILSKYSSKMKRVIIKETPKYNWLPRKNNQEDNS